MKGIAIGLSNNSKEILKRLKKTEFVKEIYIAGSLKDDVKKNELIPYYDHKSSISEQQSNPSSPAKPKQTCINKFIKFKKGNEYDVYPDW
mgnify:CR=1 FL=1